jgi:hypothetical protein
LKRPVDCCNFDSVLLEAVDEALLVYGEDTKSAFYQYFKKVLNIPKREIPARIGEFSKGLEDLFGVVMMKLHSKIGVVWEYTVPDERVLPDLTFEEYVDFAKKYFEDADNYEDKISVFVEEKKARIIYR